MQFTPVAFGCLKLADNQSPQYLENCAEVLAGAMKNGYTIFDFASAYGTHKAFPPACDRVGGYSGEVHSKITLKDIQKNGCRGAVDLVLKELALSTLDVLYLHAPDAISKETLDELGELKKEKKIKKIGLSNINLPQLKGLENKGYRPDTVQVEISPRCYDDKLIGYCRDKGIRVVGYRPLGEGKLLGTKELLEIADNHDVTTAQVIHRWCIQKGVIPLTKSGNAKRQKENRAIYDFSLTADQMRAVDGLKEKYGELRTCNWKKFVKDEDLDKANQWILKK